MTTDEKNFELYHLDQLYFAKYLTEAEYLEKIEAILGEDYIIDLDRAMTAYEYNTEA